MNKVNLKEKLAQQESAKRFHDYVKTLILLGDAVSDPSERADYYLKAADLYVNGRLIAHGEVVVVNENYGLRITSVVSDDRPR